MSQQRTAKPAKGQGSLFRDDRSPYWQMRYWNGWTEVRESARTASRKEALDILQHRLSEVARRRGEGAGPERIKVDSLLTLLIEDYRRHGKADLYQARLRVEKHLRPAFGEIIAAKLTSKDIRAYIEKRQNGAANATINRALAIIRRAYNLGALEDPPLVYSVPLIPTLKEDKVREASSNPSSTE